jgi:uncharacterized protein
MATMQRFEWLNPPPHWSGDATALQVETGDRTDFWRETFYGFTRDTGHAWLAPVGGDFTVSVRFRGAYEALYDQAGLMLRRGASSWIKTGIEFTDGLMHFSVVVTGPRSDWSVIPLPESTPATEVAARLTRHGDAVRVQYALGGAGGFEPWRMARLASFPEGPADAGLMACSPERAGFRVHFSDLNIGPPIDRRLHN